MKAEPDSRIQNGVDVGFSIDALMSKTEPEGWDGVRNYVARNNMRAMREVKENFQAVLPNYHADTSASRVTWLSSIIATAPFQALPASCRLCKNMT